MAPTGSGSLIAEEGAAIYQMVKGKIEECRAEFAHLEEAVKEQMSGKPKKKKKKGGPGKSSSPSPSKSSSMGDGVADYLGSFPENFNIDDIDSDSGGSLSLEL